MRAGQHLQGADRRLAASLRKTAADMPERWLFLPIKDGNVRLLSFYGLMESTQETAPASAGTTLDARLAAAEGDASGFWLASTFADLLVPRLYVWGQYAAAARVDAEAARHYVTSGPGRTSNLGWAATAFGWGGAE